MTQTEETTLKQISKHAMKSIVGWGVGILGAAIIGLTAFYYTTKAEIQYQSEEIRELKTAVKEASPEEVARIKQDVKELKNALEDLSIQANSTARVMESFKADMERKSDKMLELLIQIKSQ